MQKLTLVAITSALILGGCAAYNHSHDADDNYAGMHEHHEQMAAGHSHDTENKASGHMAGGHMEGGHMEGGHMGGHGHGTGESLAGKPGKASQVDRVIKVTADDNMRFNHTPLNVKEGETIKFVITNKGTIPHEFSIATKDEHMEHGEMMMANPNMHHGPGGNTVTVNPGETQELIWMFENAWQIEAACNIPGHYQAGMHSPVTVKE